MEREKKEVAPPCIELKTAPDTGSVCVNKNQFRLGFRQYHGGALDGILAKEWETMVAAGGSVCAALLGRQDLDKKSDVDLFFHGLTKTQARAKVIRLFNQTKQPGSRCVRTKHTVTFVSRDATRRNVQIILRIADSPVDVVRFFDVDACAVYYDNNSVYGLRRAARAYATTVNMIDLTYRSWAYEKRLVKYACRGFAIGAPGLDRTRVELREVKEISVSRGDLPPSDPRYVNFKEEHKFAPNVEDNGHCAVCRARAPDSCKYSSKRFVDGEWVSSWLKVVVGKELRFRNGDKLPDTDDYNNATGMRKLLLAEFCRDKMGLFRGKKRKKFLPSDAEAAEWKINSIGQDYGPDMSFLQDNAYHTYLIFPDPAHIPFTFTSEPISKGKFDFTNEDWEGTIYHDPKTMARQLQRFATVKCAKCYKREGVVDNKVKKFNKCARCKSVYYCSEACQKSHWLTHKSACLLTRK